MKLLLTSLALASTLFLSCAAVPTNVPTPAKFSVQVNTNGVLLAPTNFFNANPDKVMLSNNGSSTNATLRWPAAYHSAVQLGLTPLGLFGFMTNGWAGNYPDVIYVPPYITDTETNPPLFVMWGNTELYYKNLASKPGQMLIVDSNGLITNSITGLFDSLTVTNSLSLGSTGAVYIGESTFLHAHAKPGGAGANTFLGLAAGNLTLGGTAQQGSYNTGLGYLSLNGIAKGSYNTAVGSGALLVNSNANHNTAIGRNSMNASVSGSNNTAVGSSSMALNNGGGNNSAFGYAALRDQTTPSDNTALGYAAFTYLMTGKQNVALGSMSGVGGVDTNNYSLLDERTVFLGYSASRELTGDTPITNSVAIGANSKVAASGVMALGGSGTNALKVGIGTNAASESLEVVGNIKASGVFIGNGKGLTNLTAWNVGYYTNYTNTAAQIPNDGTLPQSSEGFETVTASISPLSASSTLKITFNGDVTSSGSLLVTAALFRNSETDAIAATCDTVYATHARTFNLLAMIPSTSTNTQTFKIRVGLVSGGTMYINGNSATSLAGGLVKHTLLIEEK